MKRSVKYRQQHAAAREKAAAILAAAEATNGVLTTEQQTAYDAHLAEMATLLTAIEREEALEAAERVAPAVPGPAGNGAGARVTVGAIRGDADPMRGFANHQDFLLAVLANSGLRDREQVQDERLRPLALMDPEDKRAAGELAFAMPRAFMPGGAMFRAAVGSDEQGEYSNTYGGFSLVTTRLAPRPLIGFEGDPTASRTEAIPMASPSVEMEAAVDKDHRTSVAAGLIVTRRPETVLIGSSRMAYELITLKATGLFGLSFATEELLDDSPVSWIARLSNGFNRQFAAQILNEKLRGGGGNEYLGVLTALAASSLGPTISIAKESGQAIDTVVAQNVLKMRSRCWGYSDAIWLANHDCYPQLATMAIPVGVAGQLVYQQSIVEDRPDMLLGRPIFYTEYAGTIGDQGDLILGNWSQYMEGTYQPMRSAESIHVRFLNHERAFKFWIRNAGAPSWRIPLTPNKSTNTLSPFVVLDAR